MSHNHTPPSWCTDLLLHCSRNVRRYKDIPPNLTAFPIVGKRDITADYKAFIASDSGVNPEEIAAILQDAHRSRASISEGTRWRNVVIEETSGTSGIPFNFPKFVSERAMAACEIWKWRRKIDPYISNRTLYPFLHAPIGFEHAFPPSNVSPDNIEKLYSMLSSKNVRWVHGPPELLRQHAAILQRLGPNNLTVKYFESSGLYMSQEAKEEIEALPLTVVNQYGCRETWVIGYGLSTTSDFDVLSENVFVEIVDETGNPVLHQGTLGDVLVTSRFQRLMPFVRYHTGDRACWAPSNSGRKLILMNGEREPGAWRWGKWGSGSRFFRIMIARSYMETGYIPLRYLQIREEKECSFTVVTDDTPRRREICVVLQKVCEASAPRGIRDRFTFSSKALNEDELRLELTTKPKLFKNMPTVDPVKTKTYF